MPVKSRDRREHFVDMPGTFRYGPEHESLSVLNGL
ncbi:protein of unknown function [Nitrospira japonica]|uniref:Uncharacterized protein n=1 Tax=Nitrospira japonica TaxID=1325564 RepID=A0A1W1HZR1_9BACT|nr:protein of unknown function [Nitrospira japonica]